MMFEGIRKEDISPHLRIIGARENENLSHRSLYLYEMDCDVGSMSNATDVKFVIGGHEFVLNPEDYVEETSLDLKKSYSYFFIFLHVTYVS